MSNAKRVQDLCAKYLDETWHSFANEIEVDPTKVGFGNQTFRCTLNQAEPKDVIVKIYGNGFKGTRPEDKLQSVAGETIIFYKLSTVGIAPKLFAAFDEGRIEQFIPGRTLSNQEFASDKQNFVAIAKILAKIHNQSMPVTKRLNFLDSVKSRFGSIDVKELISKFPVEHHLHLQKLIDFPLNNEIKWIEENARYIKSRIVFCHNDCHNNNVIKRETLDNNDDSLVLVDYEMSGYHYRGFDLGYLLSSLCFAWVKKDDKITIEFVFDIDEDIEKLLVGEYLKELKRFGDLNEELDTFDHLLMETRYFALLAHLVLICYVKSMFRKPHRSTEIGSFAFISKFMENFYSLKHSFLVKYPNLCQFKLK